MLSVKEKADLLDAIFAYVCGTEAPKLEGMAKMAFSFIRSGLDRDAEKYENTCKKRRQAALDRWHKDVQMDANASKSIECNAMHYEGDTDNKTDTDNKNVCDSEGVMTREGTGTHTLTRDIAEEYYKSYCQSRGVYARSGFIDRFMEYKHGNHWREDIQKWVDEDIEKGVYDRKSKKEPSTGRFYNYEPSGTDWNAIADSIMVAQDQHESKTLRFE